MIRSWINNTLVRLRFAASQSVSYIRNKITNIRKDPSTLRPKNSLAVQISLLTAVVSIVAIMAVILAAWYATNQYFTQYLQNQMLTSAQFNAQKIGANYDINGGNLDEAIGMTFASTNSHTELQDPNDRIWIMDRNGNAIISNTANQTNLNQDKTIILAALQNTMMLGKSATGQLPDSSRAFFYISGRAYAVAPIISNLDGVIGAIAVTSVSELRGGGTGFITNVVKLVILSGTVIAIIAAIIGYLLAGRISRPINKLVTGVKKIEKGDFSSGAEIDDWGAPHELITLSSAINQMAESIEHDIEELRRQKDVQRALLANVAHELNTPLAAIRGYSEALIDNIVSDAATHQSYYEIINRESIRMQKLAQQLSQIARFDAKMQTIQCDAERLNRIVQYSLEVVQVEAQKKQIQLKVEIPENLPNVYVDGELIEQVFVNLIGNAIRFSPEKASIEISAAKDVSEDTIWVAISDHGPGIPQNLLSQIFNRFYRIDTQQAEENSHSGLGLAIARSIIVEGHNGEIYAENIAEGGARFTFSLPIARNSANTIISDEKRVIEPASF